MRKIKQKEYIESKSGLAKLLASENLHLIHDPDAPTAYIDLKGRVITLPVLEKMSGPIYDGLICHEISHALHTPKDGWLDFCKEYPGVFLNVTEDVRIEKIIQKKYPGCKKDFVELYRDLHSRDFFGLKDRDLNKCTILDKLNLHYKIGHLVMVPFEPGIEQDFKRRLGEVMTFQEARDIAIEIYEYMKKEGQVQEVTAEVDLFFAEDNDDAENQQQQAQEGKGDYTGNAKCKTSGSKKASNGGKYMAGSTRKDFADNAERHVFKPVTNGQSCFADVYRFPKSYKKGIMTRDEVYKELSTSSASSYPTAKYDNFMNRIKPTISEMINRFNMKKAAHEYKHIQNSATGRINPKKIGQYKINNNIFFKSEHLPNSQSHGLVISVDLSSSMSSYIKSTISQVIILVEFCRRQKIPYDVYGFSNNYRSRSGKYINVRAPQGTVTSNDLPGLQMYHLLSSNDKHDKHSMKSRVLYTACDNGSFQSSGISMGCTPLTSQSFVMEYILKDFRRQHNIQKLSYILLSDGSATDRMDVGAENVYMRNPLNSKIFHCQRSKNAEFHTITEYLRDTCMLQSSVGFYLTNSVNSHLIDYLYYDTNDRSKNYNIRDIQDEFANKGSCSVPPSNSFDSFFITDINNFFVDNSGKGNIQSGSKFIFLNKFIDLIS